MTSHTPQEVWILGALGRSGRAVAAELAARQQPLVLVGRNAAALQDLAARIGGTSRIIVADSVKAMCAEVAASTVQRPAVVFNVIGPFAQTALPVIQACAPGSSYLDLSNELPALIDVLALNDDAVATNRCLVPGSGWGVLGCESIALKVCTGHPSAAKIRVDSIPYVNSPPGPLGHTLASTIIESFPAGVRMYQNGRLVPAAVGGYAEALTMPDGSKAKTGNAGLGDLEAARRAAKAAVAVAASNMIPTGLGVRAFMPLIMALLSSKSVRNFAVRQMAKINAPEKKPEERNSWARAQVEWPDGAVRTGWLRTGDAGDFTAKTAAEVAFRLAHNERRAGAYTPGALFGFELAIAAGGEFVLDQPEQTARATRHG